MASVYTNKYVSDIPLKRPQETFVDDPGSLDEVNLTELEFDLANDIKDINKLHIFHAVAVFKTVLKNLIFLGQNRDALLEFRRQRLEASSIDVDVLSGQIQDLQLPNPGFHADDLPLPVEEPSFEPLKKVLSIESTASDMPAGVPEREFADTWSLADDFEEPKPSLGEEGAFISTESLVQSTSLEMVADPITTHCIDRLKKEVLFHMSPKIKKQADYLLRSFSLAKEPQISIDEFLVRIMTYLPSISVSVYIHSAYMIYKLCVFFDAAELNALNVHRFILALLRCLTKKLEDVHQKQKNFATVGGVALSELCKIEVSFLYLFNFKMVVSEFILNDFLTKEFVSLCKFCREHQSAQEKNKT